MGIFSKMREPVFLKEDSSAKEQLAALKALLPQASGKVKTQLEQDIRNLQYGIYGEDKIIFELKNSHMPMFVLHDLFLEDEDQSAQIDFYIVTPKMNFVLECKNLYGNIEITEDGSFIRTMFYGRKVSKEGIYSPVTQNERHLELIKKIRGKNCNAFTRAMFDKYYYSFNRSLIVLANPKTVLNDQNAPQEIKSHVIRADQLIRYIKSANGASKELPSSAKEMETHARAMLSLHKASSKDYTEKYALHNQTPQTEESAPEAVLDTEKSDAAAQTASIPHICPKCGGKLARKKGPYGWFWGCANYPECKYTKK